MIQVGSKENGRRANATSFEKFYSEGEQKDVAEVFLFEGRGNFAGGL